MLLETPISYSLLVCREGDESKGDPKELREEIIQDATDLKNDIADIISALDKHHKHVNIAKITGAAASIGGAAAVIAGTALCLTGVGAVVGVPLAAAGVGVATAGGVTNVGAGLVEHFLGKHNLANVQKKLDALREQMQALNELLGPTLKEDSEFGGKNAVATGKATCEVETRAVSFWRKFYQAAKATKTVKVATGPGKAVLKGFGRSSIVLTVLFMPFDIYDIVTNAKDLHQKKGNEHCDKLQQMYDALDLISKGEF
ncbi:hypothetical protein BaRGS_00028972 [Batillaria attramentaria]|uniref:Uncharacterized protein n=1 Tax=Batillaria attramentaria TaxID=370345 RepID=A0ABD0JYK4_9CAEN